MTVSDVAEPWALTDFVEHKAPEMIITIVLIYIIVFICLVL